MKIQKTKKILVLNICKNPLHYFEFVKPIEDILKKEKVDYQIRHYNEIKKNDLVNYEKVIIPGTSLKDNSYLEDIDSFSWIKTFKKPILGICAGMQIIGLVFEGKIKKETKKEIGFYYETFNKNFLNITLGEQEVYHLHKNYISLPKEFEKFTNSKIPQAIKHKSEEIYGVLFHPEVRQKDLIKEFIRNY